MGERTFMDTTNVSVLTQRIQELEKENARLKAILDKNGIEYESFESKTCNSNHIEATSVSICQFTLQEKVSIFQSVFQGRDDVLLNVGIVVRPKSLAINLYARENGIENFAINENISVRIVLTGSSLL